MTSLATQLGIWLRSSLCGQRAAARLVVGLAVLLSALTAPAHAEKRVALVIGNAAYTEAGRLANALNDARGIGAALGRLGFDVTSAEDLTSERFEKAVADFTSKARGADVALFFYAGHALQLGQTNYLMPIDAKLPNELAVKRETMAAQDVVELMEGAARINLVFLDACRNNPLAERLRATLASSGRGASLGRGLGRIDAKGRDTLIVFSAEPGQEAIDMDGGTHSPFAAGLLQHMETPGLEIETMLKKVTKAVRDATGSKQQPERLSRLESEFYFKLEATILSPPTPTDQQVAVGPAPPKIEPPASRPIQAIVGLFPTTRAAKPLSPAEERALKPGDMFKECEDCPEIVVVPAGSFMMGSPSGEEGRRENEGPQHEVTIGQPFAVGKAEVTRGQFATFVKATGYKPGDKCWTIEDNEERSGRSYLDPGYKQDGTHPVVCVNWDDARAYAAWLTRTSDMPYRLLSEAEWEYAARAGATTRYAFGSTITKQQAQYSEGQWGSAGKTVDVGSFKPNAFDLHDMHGNVGEWVDDCYADTFKGAPTDGSAVATGKCKYYRVVRGGSWANDPVTLRSAFRIWTSFAKRTNDFGFRVARTLGP